MDSILVLKIAAVTGAIIHAVLVIGNGAYASTIGLSNNRGRSIRLHKTASRWNIVVLAVTIACLAGALWHSGPAHMSAIYMGATLLVVYSAMHVFLNGLRHRTAHAVVAMLATVVSFFYIAYVAAALFPA